MFAQGARGLRRGHEHPLTLKRGMLCLRNDQPELRIESVWKKMGRRNIRRPKLLLRKLEVEAKTQGDYASRIRPRRLAKVIGVDVIYDVAALDALAASQQVEIVEEVKGVDTEFDLGVFAKYLHVRQPKRLDQGCVQ